MCWTVGKVMGYDQLKWVKINENEKEEDQGEIG